MTLENHSDHETETVVKHLGEGDRSDWYVCWDCEEILESVGEGLTPLDGIRPEGSDAP